MSERDIVHENGRFWVHREARGLYRLYEVRGCASYRCGTFHFSNDPERALSLAIEQCDKRAGTAARLS